MAFDDSCERELTAIERAARAVLPQGVAVCGARMDVQQPLFPAERLHVACAVPRRRLEFATARSCARAALQAVGFPAQPIPAGPMREPLWPSGAIGSITHHGEYCLAAAQHKALLAGLGIDLADTIPLDAELVTRICTAEDQQAIRRAGPLPADPRKIVFCVKEAAYKCLFPLVGKVFGFHDVSAALERGGRAVLALRNAKLFRGIDAAVECRFAVTAKHVVAAAWIAAVPAAALRVS